MREVNVQMDKENNKKPWGLTKACLHHVMVMNILSNILANSWQH